MDRRSFLVRAGVLGASTATLPWASRIADAAERVRLSPPSQASLVTRWDRDPWSRGSYSALPPGVRPAVRRVLGDAVLGGRITLAGEFASTAYPGTTTGAYLSGQRAARRLLRRLRIRRAIVVGAGLAGAAAARELLDAGAQVRVLEARDRIGGRILSDRSWGEPVELGAAWIHGSQGNPLVALARDIGLRLLPTDYDDAVVRDTVTGRVSPEAERRWGRLGRLTAPLEERCGPVDRSVGAYLRRRGWTDDRIDSWATQVEITQEYGVGPGRLGVRAYCEGRDYRGGDLLVAGGYDRIPQQLLAGVDVDVLAPVARVVADGDAVRVIMQSGDRLGADAVVVAVPLALLRAGLPDVGPMPGRIRSALDALSTGNLEKVILRYDEAWWGARQVYGIVGGGAPGAPPGSPAALRWTEFYSLTDAVGFPVLAGFAGGSSARERPRSAAGCTAEAEAALAAAFGRAVAREA